MDLDFFQTLGYVPFWSGLVIMISLHNMGVSVILYKTRQTNVSNLLKIIFNFGNALRFGALAASYLTPRVASLGQCIAIQYIMMVGNVIIRLSLAAFLLWRLRQVQNDVKDKWICIILFVMRAALVIPMFSSQRPKTALIPDFNYTYCFIVDATARPFSIAGIGVEFLIDIYVTIRLIQILRKANKNAAQLSTTGAKSKRTLFTAVIYWNFLRLFVASISSVFGSVDQFALMTELPAITTKGIINILLSYVITVDAEIVRVIEGKNTKKGSSAGTEKSFKSMSPSPRSPHTPYSGRSTNSLPKYSQSQSYNNSSFNETHSQLDEDKVVVVSMKRLSFFEWANVVVGKKLRRDDDMDEDEDEDVEEVINVPPKSGSEEDVEKALSQRDSTFSGTTETSTLDENPDIVIDKN